MDAAVDRNAAARPLELLGISAIEERAYRILLERHTATVADVAAGLETTSRVARRLLADLEALGLVTHTPKVPRVYIAAPPEFAVAALVKQKQAMLERVRVAIPDLEEQSARSNHAKGHEPVFETIHSCAHLGVVLEQLYKSFRSDAMCFQRAPTLTPALSPPRKQRTGARVRTITDNSVLEIPGTLARIKEDVACGEQARMLPELPFKMMIFDQRAAILSLGRDTLEKAPALLIHGGELIEALCRLFECAWERATPIIFSSHADNAKAGMGDPDVEDALISLLALGLNDKAIALELGISPATLNRRMSELMRSSGTRTRFQLGWRAAFESVSSASSTKPA
ncbi:MAG TPA: helix-turn-helix domain-containing protein [Rhodanobacteraceae bacterium]|nr:helix-turn-helix domain-containing protein [Rhodanobacteraceae bacterium]